MWQIRPVAGAGVRPHNSGGGRAESGSMIRIRPACRTAPLSRLYDGRRQQSSYLKGSAAARDALDLH